MNMSDAQMMLLTFEDSRGTQAQLLRPVPPREQLEAWSRESLSLAKEILACEAGESIRLTDARIHSPPLMKRIVSWWLAFAPKARDRAVHLSADDMELQLSPMLQGEPADGR
jgi:hypothetical protein